MDALMQRQGLSYDEAAYLVSMWVDEGPSVLDVDTRQVIERAGADLSGKHRK